MSFHFILFLSLCLYYIYREWCDGLLPYILRKYCARSINPDAANEQLAAVKVVLLDGECDPIQMEMINSILNNDGQIVMANHERITMSGQVKFIWEVRIKNIGSYSY